MPMVLANAPATFMQTINHLFFNILDSGVASILDDILVYLHIVQEHFMLHEKNTGMLTSVYVSTVNLRSAGSYAIVQYSLASMSCLKACVLVTQRYKV